MYESRRERFALVKSRKILHTDMKDSDRLREAKKQVGIVAENRHHPRLENIQQDLQKAIEALEAPDERRQ